MKVRDDPEEPDPNFAELYDRLPPATQLEPWLGWCLAAHPPVLYLGIGTGRLAAPLAEAGVKLEGVDASEPMVERLHRRLPGVPVTIERLERLALGRAFDLVIAPSNLLLRAGTLEAAAEHLAPAGRLGFELMNPHWLRSGRQAGVRVLRDGGSEVDLEVDYRLPDGEAWTQIAERMPLHAPENVEDRLDGAGLRLLWLGGAPGLGLVESPTYFVLAAARRGRSRRPSPAPGQRAEAGGSGGPGRPRRPAGR